MPKHDELCRALLADSSEAIVSGLLEITSRRVWGQAARQNSATRFSRLAKLALQLCQGPSVGKLSAALRLQLGSTSLSRRSARRLAVQVGEHLLLMRTSRDGRMLIFLVLAQGKPSDEIWARMEITINLMSTVSTTDNGPTPGAPSNDRGPASVPGK